MIRPFLLVFGIFTSFLVAEQPPIYALLGQTVSLDPPGITFSTEDILWKHKGDKVVEFNGNEQREYGTFVNRITLDWHSAELTISDLRYEDSGVYALEAFKNREWQRASFTLAVIDRVAKPTISCEMNNGNSSIKSGNQATLKCSAEARQSPSLKFVWSSHGTMQTIGKELQIAVGDGHDDKVYDCTVSNPLTKESTTFTAKDCYPDGGSAGLTVGICVAIIAAILIIVGVLFCKLKEKACFAKEKRHDVEKPPSKMKGAENKAAHVEELRGLIHRQSTLASKQPLRFLTQREINSQDDDTEDSEQNYKRECVKERIEGFERPSGKKKAREKNKQIRAASPGPPDSAQNDKEDPDVQERDPSDSKKSNDVSGDQSENKKSALQPPTASEQPEAKEEAGEEAESPSAVGVPPHAAQPHLPVTENSQNQSPQDDGGEHKDQTSSDHQTKDTTENSVEEGDSSEPEDLNKRASEHGFTAETPVKVKALINVFEPNNENRKEEDKRIPAVSPGPLDSAENNKGDADVLTSKELVEEELDPSDSEKSNDVPGDGSENKKSALQPPTASEQPEAKEEAGEEAESPSAVGVPPHAAQPHSTVTENSQNQSPQDDGGEHKDQTSSDHQTKDTTENSVEEGDSSEPEDLNKRASGKKNDSKGPKTFSFCCC
ncbi:microtubule-associated protein futsch-like isoform X3 [Acanthochromis polyacanthus]|uniref:microtubule-associated protein futsch-like isoform X3 n=1 Tax=Acanthochromis polyacanthus TaxID=80966 RepID=UPI0022343846|nr:microtubule-associated protein futsch-like isoform X3 [Acanthochromis polyacanthus]